MPFRRECGNCRFWKRIWDNLGMCNHEKRMFHTFSHEKCVDRESLLTVIKSKRKRGVKIYAK